MIRFQWDAYEIVTYHSIEAFLWSTRVVLESKIAAAAGLISGSVNMSSVTTFRVQLNHGENLAMKKQT